MNPEAVCHAFTVIAQDVKALVRRVITEAGATGIYYCVQNAETFRFTAEEYRRLVTPAELDVLKYANTLSENNILHCCGWAGDPNRVEVWQDYPSKAVNWAIYVENLPLKKGKEYFGGRCEESSTPAPEKRWSRRWKKFWPPPEKQALSWAQIVPFPRISLRRDFAGSEKSWIACRVKLYEFKLGTL